MTKVTLTDLAMIKLEELVAMFNAMGATSFPAAVLTHTLPAEGIKMVHEYRKVAVKRGIVKACVKTPDGSLNFIL